MALSKNMGKLLPPPAPLLLMPVVNVHRFDQLFQFFPLSREDKLNLLRAVAREAILQSQRT